MLLPDPAMESRDDQELTLDEGRELHTFSVYPQEGSGGFPLTEYTALEKPLGCTVVMGFVCVVMIGGWILGRKPL